MDLRTYPTRVVREQPPFPCTVCVESPIEGYVDIGPADILCLDCAARVQAVLGAEVAESVAVLGCDDCPRTFRTAAALGSHRRSHRVPVLV